MGANMGVNPEYKAAAIELGKQIALRGHVLLYGGGRLGLMGVLADTVLENGGKVVGIITDHLYALEAHLGLSELQIVKTMQERKVNLINEADVFLALPGGLGTLEEIFEIWNAAKLGLHNKSIGLLNTNHFYYKLMRFVGVLVEEGFLEKESAELVKISDSVSWLLDNLLNESEFEEKLLTLIQA